MFGSDYLFPLIKLREAIELNECKMKYLMNRYLFLFTDQSTCNEDSTTRIKKIKKSEDIP